MGRRGTVVRMQLTRRAFLTGAGSAGFLAACGGGDDDGGGTADPNGLVLLTVFDPQHLVTAGVPTRATVALARTDGVPLRDAPDEVAFQVLTDDGRPVGDPFTARSRAEGLPTPYFPVVLDVEDPGVYGLEATVDGAELEPSAFMANATAQVTAPGPGDPMIPVDTPTVGDARGADPICTRDPVCPFHDVTLREALGERRPTAFLVATPEFCQTEVCGPVLDVLVGEAEAYPAVRFVHAEVYADARAVDNVAQATLTEAMSAYQLTFEPSLFLAGADGVVVARLDNVYDASELREQLDELIA